MKLKDWRKKQGLSQQALADALALYAQEHYGDKAKNLMQNTVGYWERGTQPRKFWIEVIFRFTKEKVGPIDFMMTNKPYGA